MQAHTVGFYFLDLNLQGHFKKSDVSLVLLVAESSSGGRDLCIA